MGMRPSKETTLKTAILLTPKYAELLKELQKSKGRPAFASKIFQIQNNIGQYVLMYDDERKIGRSFFLYLIGKDGFQNFISELNELNESQQQEMIDEFATYDEKELDELFSDFVIPATDQEWKASEEAFLKLPEDQQQEVRTKSAYIWSFIFSTFFNSLALMVHGTKLTTLVPQAVAGDDESFLKAIQIDRMLLLHYPYFKERKFRAQNEGDVEFLQKISYRESNPPMRGKIQHPAIYVLFAILESFRWLDDLTHDEILRICDDAGLDRFQNRLGDTNSITKHLKRYRQYQKTGGVSMHSN